MKDIPHPLARGAVGLAFSNLSEFYRLARAVLVKSETYYDQYGQAFQAAFEGIETPTEVAEEVWRWLAEPTALAALSDEEREALALSLGSLGLAELRRMFEERLLEQTEAHHGAAHPVAMDEILFGTKAFPRLVVPTRDHARDLSYQDVG